MDDEKLVKLLKEENEKALKRIIFAYTPYVSAVIANQIGNFKNISVIEELCSDVFAELWRKKGELKTYHLRGWLGATARNMAKNYIRSQKMIFESLEEDFVVLDENSVYEQAEADEQRAVLNQALSNLKENEREIIIRYYYYNQTVSRISAETGTNIETVKSRLRRGREKLKKTLEKGGYFVE